MRDLAGRVAVVTGAASGIGFAMAERFAAEGMKVVLADIETPALERAEAALRGKAAAALATRVDVSRAEDVRPRSARDQAGSVRPRPGHHGAPEPHPAAVGRPVCY